MTTLKPTPANSGSPTEKNAPTNPSTTSDKPSSPSSINRDDLKFFESQQLTGSSDGSKAQGTTPTSGDDEFSKLFYKASTRTTGSEAGTAASAGIGGGGGLLIDIVSTDSAPSGGSAATAGAAAQSGARSVNLLDDTPIDAPSKATPATGGSTAANIQF